MIEGGIIFDSDCFRSFLEVDEEEILFSLYPGKIFLPYDVFHEISNIPLLRQKIYQYETTKEIFVLPFLIPNPFLTIYLDLTEPQDNRTQIGKGEASAIVLAMKNNATLASNNLRDIVRYVEEFHLEHITTSLILCEAVKKNLITMDQGKRIWENMFLLGNKFPTDSLDDYWEKYYSKGKI